MRESKPPEESLDPPGDCRFTNLDSDVLRAGAGPFSWAPGAVPQEIQKRFSCEQIEGDGLDVAFYPRTNLLVLSVTEGETEARHSVLRQETLAELIEFLQACYRRHSGRKK